MSRGEPPAESEGRAGLFTRWSSKLGFPTAKQQRLFIFTAALDALGTGLIGPITLLYFTLDRHIPAVQVGLGLSIAGIGGMIATPLAGALVDRFGPRVVGAGCHIVSAFAFAFYLAANSFVSFVAVVFLAAAADRMFRPAKTSLAAALTDEKDRVKLLAVHRSLRNVGYGLGGALATVALAAGTHEAYVIVILGNAFSYLVTATLLWRLNVAPQGPSLASEADTANTERASYKQVMHDRRYLGLTAMNMVMLLHASVLEIGIPLWIVHDTSAPKAVAGVLFTVNTVLVVGLQIVATRFADDVRGAARAYGYASGALVLMCALFAAAAGASEGVAIVLLVAAVLSLTVGEVLATVGEWGLSLGLAPEVGQGRYLAIFSTGSAAQIAFGPLLITALIVELGSDGWAVLAAIFLACGLGAWFLGRDAQRPASAPVKATVGASEGAQ